MTGTVNVYTQGFLFIGPTLRDAVRISFTNRPYILLGSVVLALVCALFLLSSKEAIRIAGSWVQYVGYAFATFCFQYSFRYIAWLSGDSYKFLNIGASFLADVCSGVNNLFFLAAGCVLLNWKTEFLRRKYFVAIVLATGVLMSTANQYFEERSYLVVASLFRLPDALFSAFCIGLFGAAAAFNLASRRRNYWAAAGLVIGLIYAGIQLQYAANPLIAKWKGESIQPIITQARYRPRPSDPTDFLDGAVFAVALPMKFLLFLPTAYLFFSFIIEAHDFRKVLRRVIGEYEPAGAPGYDLGLSSFRTSYKQDYLSSDGIVREIGESVSADLVELFIRLPGTKRPRAWPIAWRPGQSDEREPRVISLDPADSDCDLSLREVMSTSIEVLKPLGKAPDQDVHISRDTETPKALIMLPIGFHGGVVGCLKAEFSKARHFNYATVRQLKSMAALLAPAVQDYRALASLDQLGYRFARLQIENPAADFRDATAKIAEILVDVLAPLAVGVLVEAGFQSTRVVLAEDNVAHLLEDQNVRYEPENLTTIVSRAGSGPVRIHKNLLVMTTRDDGLNTYPIGNLVLLIRGDHDYANSPSLGAYGLHRRAISSLTADAFLDLVRDYLSMVLKNLSIRLNVDGLTRDQWHAEISTTARDVGILWVAVTQSGNRNLWGDEAGQIIVKSLSDHLKTTLSQNPLSCEVHSDQVTKTQSVLRMKLTASNYELWFGIAREGFDHELDCASPWKIFLESLSEIADSALVSLFEKERSQAAVAKLSEDRGVMNIAITTGQLMHDLANKVDVQDVAAESVWKAIGRGDIQIEKVQQDKVRAIMHAAKEMKSLVAVFKDVTKLDRRRPCRLHEAAQQAMRFYENVTRDANIVFENRIDPLVQADITFDVAYFAIANLIGNSRDVLVETIESNKGGDFVGKIRIETGEEEDRVACWVVDNGPGIPREMRHNLFTLGESLKEGHNGWGLYFTQQALELNGATIQLTESNLGFTRFTLRFPKVNGAYRAT